MNSLYKSNLKPSEIEDLSYIVSNNVRTGPIESDGTYNRFRIFRQALTPTLKNTRYQYFAVRGNEVYRFTREEDRFSLPI